MFQYQGCKLYSLLILRGYLDYKHVHLHLFINLPQIIFLKYTSLTMFYIHVSAFNTNFKFCSFRYRKRTTATTTALLDDQKRAKIADASQSCEESSQLEEESQQTPSQESSQLEEESQQSPSHQKLMLPSGFYKFVIYVLLLVWRSSKREVDEVLTRNRTLEAENQRLKANCDRLKKENEKLPRGDETVKRVCSNTRGVNCTVC